MLKLPGESSKVGAYFLAISALFKCNLPELEKLKKIITHFSCLLDNPNTPWNSRGSFCGVSQNEWPIESFSHALHNTEKVCF